MPKQHPRGESKRGGKDEKGEVRLCEGEVKGDLEGD